VLVAVELLSVSVRWHGAGTRVSAVDFPVAFLGIAVLMLGSLFVFLRLPKDVGAELRDSR
jgi:hypothetical protein